MDLNSYECACILEFFEETTIAAVSGNRFEFLSVHQIKELVETKYKIKNLKAFDKACKAIFGASTLRRGSGYFYKTVKHGVIFDLKVQPNLVMRLLQKIKVYEESIALMEKVVANKDISKFLRDKTEGSIFIDKIRLNELQQLRDDLPF